MPPSGHSNERVFPNHPGVAELSTPSDVHHPRRFAEGWCSRPDPRLRTHVSRQPIPEQLRNSSAEQEDILAANRVPMPVDIASSREMRVNTQIDQAELRRDLGGFR